MPDPPLDRVLEINVSGESAIVQVRCDMVVVEVGDLIRARLLGLVHEQGFRQVYVDLNGLKWLGDDLLGFLIRLHKTLKDVGGRLVICNRNPPTLEVFKITRLDKLLDIRPELPEELFDS